MIDRRYPYTRCWDIDTAYLLPDKSKSASAPKIGTEQTAPPPRNETQRRRKSEKRKRRKKKRAAGDIISIIILIIAITVAAAAGYKLYGILMEYKKGNDEYAEIKNMAVKTRDADIETEGSVPDGEENRTHKVWSAPIEVDFHALQDINSDVVGWLYVEAIPEISYPVVQGKDNDYYLHRTYKKEDVFAGSIFIDYENSPDFSDQNTIVYGHNMKDQSMFGRLKQFKLQETLDKSPYFWILTPEGNYKYEIFSEYVAAVDGDTYTLIKGPGQGTIDYANKMRGLSLYQTYTKDFQKTDNIVTLSTCTGDTSTRFVVQGVRIYPD